LKEYEYVFVELSRLPPNKDIDFSIDLIPGAALVSKNPYKHTNTEIIANAYRRVVEEGVNTPKCFSLGCSSSFCE
jgi:hypothetical protein